MMTKTVMIISLVIGLGCAPGALGCQQGIKQMAGQESSALQVQEAKKAIAKGDHGFARVLLNNALMFDATNEEAKQLMMALPDGVALPVTAPVNDATRTQALGMVEIAKGMAATKQTQSARQYAESALKMSPGLPEATAFLAELDGASQATPNPSSKQQPSPASPETRAAIADEEGLGAQAADRNSALVAGLFVPGAPTRAQVAGLFAASAKVATQPDKDTYEEARGKALVRRRFVFEEPNDSTATLFMEDVSSDGNGEPHVHFNEWMASLTMFAGRPGEESDPESKLIKVKRSVGWKNVGPCKKVTLDLTKENTVRATCSRP